MKIFYMILLCIIPCVTGCKKKVHKVNPDFIGEWKSDIDNCYCVWTINIDEDSKGVYQASGGFSDCSANSVKGIVRLKDDKLKIGLYTWKIIEQPVQLDSTSNGCNMTRTWRMILNEPKILSGAQMKWYK